MFFTGHDKLGYSLTALTSKVKSDARYSILAYPMRSTELQLDQYLQKNFKYNLKSLCLYILDHIQVAKSPGSLDYTIFLTDPKLDTFANLVTFGNSSTPGSQILKNSFNNE